MLRTVNRKLVLGALAAVIVGFGLGEVRMRPASGPMTVEQYRVKAWQMYLAADTDALRVQTWKMYLAASPGAIGPVGPRR